MSSAKHENSRATLNLERTRQQLRELENLLQQMLALPLDDSGSLAAAPAVTHAAQPQNDPLVSLRVYAPPAASDESGASESPTAPTPPESNEENTILEEELRQPPAPPNDSLPEIVLVPPPNISATFAFDRESMSPPMEIALPVSNMSLPVREVLPANSSAGSERIAPPVKNSAGSAAARPVHIVLAWTCLLLLLAAAAIGLACWLTWPT